MSDVHIVSIKFMSVDEAGDCTTFGPMKCLRDLRA